MPAGSQPFPDGAVIRRGMCGGAFCRDAIGPADVVRCRVGESIRTAMALELCADCIADFAVMNGEGWPFPPDVKVVAVTFPGGSAEVHDLPRFRIYAEAGDGLYHEVTGSVP